MKVVFLNSSTGKDDNASSSKFIAQKNIEFSEKL